MATKAEQNPQTPPSDNLKFHKNVEFDPDKIDFETFMVKFENYLVLNKIESDTLKRALLIDSLTSKPLQTLISLCKPESPSKFSFENLLKKLSENYKKITFKSTERYYFFTYKQKQNDSIQDFANQLKNMTTNCGFPANFLQDALVTAFIIGINDGDIRKNLLQKDWKNLEDAVQQAKILDGVLNTKISETTSSDIAVQKISTFKRPTQFSTPYSNKNTSITPCDSCGGSHLRKNCKFRFAKCNNCGIQGHISTACRSLQREKGPSQFHSKKNTNHSTKITPDKKYLQRKYYSNNITEKYESDFDVLNIDSNLPQTSKFCIPVNIDNKTVNFELDTGSCVTICCENVYNLLGRPSLHKSNISLASYSGHSISLLGEKIVEVEYNERCVNLKLFFASGTTNNVLGRDWIDGLNLTSHSLNEFREHSSVLVVSLQNISTLAQQYSNTNLRSLLEEFSDLFRDELGHCKKFKAQLYLNSNAVPIFRKARPLPFATRDLVEGELNRLINLGILEPIEYSEWASPIVCVRKPNGTVRICADFSTGLNKSLNVQNYPLPTSETIFASLSSGQQFSVIDFTDAYFQIEVDEDSRKLLVINTHKGLLQYKRLPFGIASAPAQYQRIMDQMLKGLKGVAWYLDDIIVTGRTKMQHLQNLRAVFERIREYGFRIKKSKSSFFKDSIEFLGFVIDKNGIHKSPKKVHAIVNMPRPANLKELESYIGMVVYYSKFIPHLSEVLYPLNQLRKKNAVWHWTPQCEKSFQRIKTALTSSQYLTHYDSTLPLILATDGSQKGIGCVLFHRFPDNSERVIAYASKTLTSAEQRYAQIERESLAVVFGIKKFHQYLWGREFLLQTDHKALLQIFGSKRGIPVTTANRIQRWSIFLMGYNFKIEYVPTQKLGHADGLSRLPSGPDKDFDSNDYGMKNVVFQIQEEIQSELPITSFQIAQATTSDSNFRILKEAILTGWPKYFQNSQLEQYFRLRNELSIHNECIMWGTRTVIPPKHRKQLLDYLHLTHAGVVRMKSEARRYFYWPQLNDEIEKLASSCKICASISKDPTKVPLGKWQPSTSPWSRIHIDHCGPFMNKLFLIIVDSHSKWPEVIHVKDTSSSTTISVLKSMFARYGLCEEIVSDNATGFTSSDFKLFCRKLGIRHTLIPSYCPMSNGQAERYVQSFKNAMKKIFETNPKSSLIEAIQNYLLRYRNTPHPATGATPSERFLKRQLRTVLDLLRPESNVISKTYSSNAERNFNKRTKDKTLTIGQKVHVKLYKNNSSFWREGIIINRISKNVWLVDVNGLQVRKHRNQIKPFKHSVLLFNNKQNATTTVSRSPVQLRRRSQLHPPQRYEVTN